MSVVLMRPRCENCGRSIDLATEPMGTYPDGEGVLVYVHLRRQGGRLVETCTPPGSDAAEVAREDRQREAEASEQ